MLYFAFSDVNEKNSIYAFLLNVKGRIVFDLLIYKQSNDYLIETDSSGILKLENLLKIYRLKRKIEISQVPETSVYFALEKPSEHGKNDVYSCPDPRISSFGYRILKRSDEDEPRMNDYLLRRLEWGIPEGLDELADEIPLTFNADLMNGISFEKGNLFQFNSLINF